MLTETMHETIKQVERLFEVIDRETAEFESKIGVHCLAGCGGCCHSPTVEATFIEMIPMAFDLNRKGKAEQLHETLTLSPPPRCVMFQPHEGSPLGGHCGVYRHRPTVCRLFGYVAFLDKHHKPRYSFCHLMKARYPQELAAIQAAIATGELIPPLMPAMQQLLDDISGGIIIKRLPINEALRVALEYVGLQTFYCPDADQQIACENMAG
jgi:Fe-S-cluster containining protein